MNVERHVPALGFARDNASVLRLHTKDDYFYPCGPALSNVFLSGLQWVTNGNQKAVARLRATGFSWLFSREAEKM